VVVEPTRLIDQLTIIRLNLPLWTQWFRKYCAEVFIQAVQRPAQPNVEEIHQIGVWDSIVVGGIGHYGIECTFGSFQCRLSDNRTLTSIITCGKCVIDHARDPLDRGSKIASGL